MTKDQGIEGLTLDKKKLIIGDISSSSKKVLSKALKHPSSMLEVYKEQNFVGSSLNILKTNQKYS